MTTKAEDAAKKLTETPAQTFSRRLKEGHYNSLVGARRAVSRMGLGPDDAKKAMAAARKKLGE
jgi:hypothetical protein